MRAIFLFIVCTAISTGFVHAKGPEPIEVTPESIEQKDIPWEIRVQNEAGENSSPDYTWFFSIFIKLQEGERYKNAVPVHTTTPRPVGRLEMRDKDGNLLMSADLSPNTENDQAVEYQFSVHKKHLASFSFWFRPLGETSPQYFVRLDKLVTEKTLPQRHLEWPRPKHSFEKPQR